MIFRKAAEHAKKHPGLIPQFFFICLGMGGAFLYLIRLAKGPHVTWNKTSNPEPWNQLDPTYQYKVTTCTRIHSHTDLNNSFMRGRCMKGFLILLSLLPSPRTTKT
uniref:NDUFA4 mitochondrial complex associated like 2 n=1 Tax=Takifugu rubripes TaxID=31033 RepID=A0A674P0Q6_TAKRU